MNVEAAATKVKIWSDFAGLQNGIDNQIPTPQIRKQISNIIKVGRELGFERKDNDGKIELWNLNEAMVIIAVGNNGKIWICNDALWGTICGMNEQVQEYQAELDNMRYED